MKADSGSASSLVRLVGLCFVGARLTGRAPACSEGLETLGTSDQDLRRLHARSRLHRRRFLQWKANWNEGSFALKKWKWEKAITQNILTKLETWKKMRKHMKTYYILKEEKTEYNTYSYNYWCKFAHLKTLVELYQIHAAVLNISDLTKSCNLKTWNHIMHDFWMTFLKRFLTEKYLCEKNICLLPNNGISIHKFDFHK